MSITIKAIDSSGSNRWHAVTGVSLESLKSAGFDLSTDRGDYIEVKTGNKRQASALSEFVAQKQSEKTAPSNTGRNEWTTRRVVRARDAETLGLNHGRTWVCGELDIQTKGAHPSWEGESICYVYE